MFSESVAKIALLIVEDEKIVCFHRHCLKYKLLIESAAQLFQISKMEPQY